MFNSAYDTTACKGYVMDQITKAIRLSLVNHELVTLPTPAGFKINLGTDQVYGVSPEDRNTPPFAHPLCVKDLTGAHTLVVQDGRAYMRRGPTGEFIALPTSDYKQLLLRAFLQNEWNHGDYRNLENLGDFPMIAFAHWVSSSLVRRLGLDGQAQMHLNIVAAYYYSSLFRVDPIMAEQDLLKVAAKLNRVSRIPVPEIMAVADQLMPTGSIGDFVANAKTVLQSTRMDEISVGTLFAILCGGWYGNSSREVLAVALEHPPTFLAVLFLAINDVSLQKAQFSKTVEVVNRRELGKVFSANMMALYKGV